MATNPDLNITDSLNSAALLQLQQAQQLAVNNAITNALITNALAASGLPGGTGGGIDPFGDGTGGGTTTGTTSTTATANGFGSINFVNGGFTPSTSGTSGTRRTIGQRIGDQGSGGNNPEGERPGTAGTAGTSGRPTDPFDPCITGNYFIKEITELTVNANTNDQRRSVTPAFNITGDDTQCVLVGKLYKCCTAGSTSEAVFVGYVELGRSKRSKKWSPCPDGTFKPVIEHYYNLDELYIGDLIQPTTQGGNLVFAPLSTRRFTNDFREPGITWSDLCSFPEPGRTYRSFDNFQDYIKDKATSNNNKLVISGRLEDVKSVTLTSEGTIGVNQPDGFIKNSLKASCGGEGSCASTPGTSGTSGDPCVDTWNLGTSFTEEQFQSLVIPTGYLIVPGTETTFQQDGPVQVTTSTTLEPVPGNDCYLGFRQTTTSRFTKTVEYRYTKTTNASSPCVFSKTITITRTVISNPTWVQQVFNESRRNDPKCKCEDQYIDAGVIIDPLDPCGCKQYNIVKVRTKCPGETEFKDSTEIYPDGIVNGINIPAGHKLDPFIPFSLRADCNQEVIKIYHPLVLGKDIVEGKVTANTRGLFNLSQSMSCYNTSSLQSSGSKDYYYEVTDCDCDSTPYFAVAYGNVKGSGSLWSVGETNDTSTRAVYSQYRLIALEEPERKFKFYNTGTLSESDDIYAINFYRNGLSDRIDPGNFEIGLRPLNGNSYANNVHTGSNVQVSGSTVYTFIDNSNDRSDLSTCSEDPYVSYDIVSGSLENGLHDSGTGSIDTNPNITTYGKFYPNLGIMIFDPSKLNTLLGFNTVTGSNVAGDNAYKLYTSISGSGVLGSHIKARNVKYKTTNHYFVRVSPPNANYSNNPTFVSDTSTGKLLNTCFQKEPVTYVTSVGLYNNKRELLAIAKLSKPIKKTPDDDLLIKIRLNW